MEKAQSWLLLTYEMPVEFSGTPVLCNIRFITFPALVAHHTNIPSVGLNIVPPGGDRKIRRSW
ncbi:MAG: hypothetical protein P0107_05355 [Nitrosomonas sp.]|nr:hypothetical protein [Nitrosomonas sp.]